MENVQDYLKRVDLLGNTLLICVEAKISTLQMNAIAKSNFKTSNDNNLQSFYNEVLQSPRIVVKVSEEVKTDKISIGDTILFNSYATPLLYVNEDDPFDLENVVSDYNHDSKNMSLNNGIKYKVRLYYIMEAQFAVMAIKPKEITE